MLPESVEKQRAAGRLAYQLFEELQRLIKPGLNLLEIESFVRQAIKRANFQPAFLGFKNYPAVTCLSVNSAIVHGIPYSYKLQDGDVLSVDMGIANDGWIVDTARTYAVGNISQEHRRLLEVTQLALDKAIELCRSGVYVGDLGQSIQNTVESAGFAIIKDLTGHGVGRTLQEPPTIPNCGRAHTGAQLKSGQSIAIEPITANKPTDIAVLPDNWTIVAKKDVVTAHFEHTIAITDDEPIVLTGP